jgi:hypothetical protein
LNQTNDTTASQPFSTQSRKDGRSNAAVLLTACAIVVSAVWLTMVTVPGTQYAARGNPLYWLILLPVAWWVSSLAACEPHAIRWWKPALALACTISTTCLVLAVAAEQGVTLNAAGCAVTLAATVGSLVAYRGSLVAREGPAR